MPHRLTPRAGLALVLCLCAAGPAAAQPPDRAARLRSATTWMYQLAGLESAAAVAALAATDYDLLVIEPGNTLSDFDNPRQLVEALRLRPDGRERVLLAYIDIGQAEDYRTYWRKDWVRPTRDRRGRPDFLVTIDPDGWSGSFPVAFWDERWQRLWLGETGIVAELARLGYDGVYLDWVDAYSEERVVQAARRKQVNPAQQMVRFVEEIRAAGRAVTPDFLVVPQNAPYLLDEAPRRYAAAIDGLAVEDTWYRGEGDAEWNDAGAGDIPNQDDEEFSTDSRLRQYRKYLDLGLPVFTVDYCRSPDNARRVYASARRAGLRPLVTRVSLSRLTETPPEPVSRPAVK